MATISKKEGMRMRTLTWAGAGLMAGVLLALPAGPAAAQVKPEVDQALKRYDVVGAPKVEGVVRAGVTESIRRLFDLWVERFRHHHGGVKFEAADILRVEAAQTIFTGAAPIKEGADLVAVSFPLSPADLAAIKAQRGVEPVRVAVAMDAVVLIVNQKNPLPGLTMAQVAQIFSAPASPAEDIEHWKQVGVDGKFSGLEINRYGRDDQSGTYQAFKSMALKGAEQRKDVHKEPGSMSIVLEVGTDERGIGYAATGYAIRSKRVRVVPLARKAGDKFIVPTNETVLKGEYPLLRELYIYAMPESDGSLKPSVKQFIRFILSRDGQELAHDEGFFPLPAVHAEQVLGGLERDNRISSVARAMKAAG
jgi:phosphate transport system substrate-binding protein